MAVCQTDEGGFGAIVSVSPKSFGPFEQRLSIINEALKYATHACSRRQNEEALLWPAGALPPTDAERAYLISAVVWTCRPEIFGPTVVRSRLSGAELVKRYGPAVAPWQPATLAACNRLPDDNVDQGCPLSLALM
jgi:hypothetical protein